MFDDKKEFSIEGIDHIGLVPGEGSGLFDFLSKGLGLQAEPSEKIVDQKTEVQKLLFPNGTDGLALELLSPLNAEGVIQKYLERNKSGIHHLAIRVKGLDSAIKYLLSLGIKMIDEKPRIGHNKTRIAFIHPKSVSGILIELVEKSEA